MVLLALRRKTLSWRYGPFTVVSLNLSADQYADRYHHHVCFSHNLSEMAPRKRKAAGANQQPQQSSKNSPHHSGSRSNSPGIAAAAPEPGPQPGDDDSCPGCTPSSKELMKGSRKESWIECDNCNTWYHWRCVGKGEDVENISKWYLKYPKSVSCLMDFDIQVLRSLPKG